MLFISRLIVRLRFLIFIFVVWANSDLTAEKREPLQITRIGVMLIAFTTALSQKRTSFCAEALPPLLDPTMMLPVTPLGPLKANLCEVKTGQFHIITKLPNPPQRCLAFAYNRSSRCLAFAYIQ